jgi:hypothetical protein
MAATSSPTSLCQQQHGVNSASSNNGNTERQAQSDVCKQDDDDNDEVQRATSNDELHSNCVQPLINTGPASNAQLPCKQPTNICQTSNDHYDVPTDNDHYDLPAEYSRTSIDQLWHNTVDENNRSASLNTDNRPKLLKGDPNQGTAALFESPASVSPALRTAMSQSDAVSSSDGTRHVLHTSRSECDEINSARNETHYEDADARADRPIGSAAATTHVVSVGEHENISENQVSSNQQLHLTQPAAINTLKEKRRFVI